MKLLLATVGIVLSLPAAVIEGTVVNSTTGTPVGGVVVSFESAGKTAYQDTTNAFGLFRFEDVKPGNYTPDFSKDDFQISGQDAAVRRPFSVPAGSGTVRLEARLTPFGRVLGRVLDANGDPIADAELLLSGSRLALTGTPMRRASSRSMQLPGIIY